ncbi:SEL1-like repeat protein [Pseudophaeobacter flagellatus]|uniref:SEL1-like repeat protein n=1 Tax=Pseudophaeobacter flagellatus TaxID=2899119 RepID=UPI001E4B78AC|nr:tetratricopeptide repeat protein [Pseudophaeobacter flagellatus]MCD9149783.1 sel1 repeat family protein [Pseudophaeobacter flagellatus]
MSRDIRPDRRQQQALALLGLTSALWLSGGMALGETQEQGAPPAALVGSLVDPLVDPLADLRAKAQAGEAQAQYQLGDELQRGRLLVQDHAAAVAWFLRASEQGHSGAQTRLGQIYLQGLGVAADPARALQFLEQAAESGAAEPLFYLASLLEQAAAPLADPARAARLYQQAAKLGHMDAAVSLGVLYQNGTGVVQDLERAHQLYQAPAAAGHPRALNNLGLLYVRETGPEQDYGRAALLFQAAADQGLAVALNNLGTLYENGFGVALDEARAQALYRQAADLARGGADLIQTTAAGAIYDPSLERPARAAADLQQLQQQAKAGDPVAQFQLGWLILQPETAASRREELLAVQLLQAAAQAGQAAAMVNLALLYVEGRLLPQDHMLAYMWLVLAIAAGEPGLAAQASDLAASLARQIPAAQILQAQSRAQNLAQNRSR